MGRVELASAALVLLLVVSGSLGTSSDLSGRDPSQLAECVVELTRDIRSRPGSAGDVSISHIDVLLPSCHSKAPASFRLDAYNGCFDWSSTRPDLVSVTPLYATGEAENGWEEDPDDPDACSTAALVTAVGAQSERAAGWVLAREVTRGSMLRTEVFVDAVARLEILTTTRTIYLDDMEVVEVQAFDSLGNRFTTIAGLAFDWQLNAVDGSSDKVMEFVSFKDAAVRGSPAALAAEARGSESEAVLVRGASTGKVNVSATLVESSCPGVPATSAVVSVLEPLSLDPSSVYVIRGAAIHYTLRLLGRDCASILSMPNAKYIWSILDEKLGTVDASGFVVASRTVSGSSIVRVEDKGMADNAATASIHVVEPAYMRIVAVPVEASASCISASATSQAAVHYLQAGHTYKLSVVMFDADAHPITLTENMDFQLSLPSDLVKEEDRASNSAWVTVTALASGRASVSGSFTGLTAHPKAGGALKLDTPLRADQEISVVPPLALESPSSPVYMMHDASGGRQSVALRVTGGTADAKWKSAHPAVASVTGSGLVHATGPGSTVIHVVDRQACDATLKVEVVVVSPNGLEALAGDREAQIGDYLSLRIAPVHGNGQRYTSVICRGLQWSVDDAGVFSLVETNDNDAAGEDGACATQRFKALKEGSTVIKVKFGDRFETVFTVAAYPALQVVTPTSASGALIAPGSSTNVTFVGGPNPWVLSTKGWSQALSVVKKDGSVISARDSSAVAYWSPSSRGSFVVLCREFSELSLRITVTNAVSETLPKPHSSTVDVPFQCSYPASASLRPGVGVEKAASGGGRPTYSVRNDRNVPFVLSVLDPSGQEFHNYSSVEVSWSTSDQEKAGLPRGVPSHIKDNRDVSIAAATGTVILSVRVTGYDGGLVDTTGLRVSTLPAYKPVVAEAEIVLLPNVHLVPEYTALFNHPDNSVRLTAVSGSGSYHFSGNATATADLKSRAGQPYVDVIPKQAGLFGVSVTDLGLAASTDATGAVLVSDISRLVVSGPELCLRDTEITLLVTAMDSTGAPFNVSQFAYMDLSLAVDSPVLTTYPSSTLLGSYTARCVTPGVVNVFASASTSRTDPVSGSRVRLTSDARNVAVYNPVVCEETHLSMMAGTRIALTCSGGPDTGKLVYRSTSGKIVESDEQGMLTFVNPGTATIHVSSVGYDGSTQRTYSSTTVEITVRELSGLGIVCGSRKVAVGQDVVLHLAGDKGESPVSFHTSFASYTWTSSDKDVLALSPVVSVDPRSDSSDELDGDEAELAGSSFAVRLVGVAAGRATVTVRGRLSASGREYTDTCQVTVVEPLAVTLPLLGGGETAPRCRYDPHSVTRSLLLIPGGQGKIRTNRDGKGKLSFRVLSGTGLTVDSDGVVHAGPDTGVYGVVLVTDELTGEAVPVSVGVRRATQVSLMPVHRDDDLLKVGSSVDYHLVLRDDGGVPFSTPSGMRFIVRSNTYEVVSVGAANDTVTVRGLTKGTAILSVTVEDAPSIVDYLQVRVVSAIKPRAPVVHVGGSVDLGTSGPSDGGWIVSDGRPLLTVESSSGKAKALAAGTAQVSIGSDSTKVSVVQVESIEVGPAIGEPGSLTNVEGSELAHGARYPLTFVARDPVSGERVVVADRPGISQGVTWKCRVTPADFAYAKNWAEGCEIVMLPAPSAEQVAAAGGDGSLTLIVEAGDAGGSYSVSTRLGVAWQPAFAVSGGARVLTFSPANRTMIVDLVGPPGALNGLVTTSSAPESVTVTKVSEANDGSATSVSIAVANTGVFVQGGSGMHVELLNYHTGQSVRIPVMITSEADHVLATQWVDPRPGMASIGGGGQWVSAQEANAAGSGVGGYSVLLLAVLGVLLWMITRLSRGLASGGRGPVAVSPSAASANSTANSPVGPGGLRSPFPSTPTSFYAGAGARSPLRHASAVATGARTPTGAASPLSNGVGYRLILPPTGVFNFPIQLVMPDVAAFPISAEKFARKWGMHLDSKTANIHWEYKAHLVWNVDSGEMVVQVYPASQMLDVEPTKLENTPWKDEMYQWAPEDQALKAAGLDTASKFDATNWSAVGHAPAFTIGLELGKDVIRATEAQQISGVGDDRTSWYYVELGLTPEGAEKMGMDAEEMIQMRDDLLAEADAGEKSLMKDLVENLGGDQSDPHLTEFMDQNLKTESRLKIEGVFFLATRQTTVSSMVNTHHRFVFSVDAWLNAHGYNNLAKQSAASHMWKFPATDVVKRGVAPSGKVKMYKGSPVAIIPLAGDVAAPVVVCDRTKSNAYWSGRRVAVSDKDDLALLYPVVVGESRIGLEEWNVLVPSLNKVLGAETLNYMNKTFPKTMRTARGNLGTGRACVWIGLLVGIAVFTASFWSSEFLDWGLPAGGYIGSGFIVGCLIVGIILCCAVGFQPDWEDLSLDHWAWSVDQLLEAEINPSLAGRDLQFIAGSGVRGQVFQPEGACLILLDTSVSSPWIDMNTWTSPTPPPPPGAAAPASL